MIRVFLTEKITDFKSIRNKRSFSIYIPKQLILIDCIFKTLGYRACSLYLLLGEPRDEEIIASASRSLIRDLIWEFSILSGGHDLIRIGVRYPLYKNLYKLGSSDGSIYRYLANNYFENGKADIDIALCLNAERYGFKVKDGWILRERPIRITIYMKTDWIKAAKVMKNLRRSIDEFFNPLTKMLKEIEAPATQEPPPPEILIEVLEGRVIRFDNVKDRLTRISGNKTIEGALSKILEAISTSKIYAEKESGVKMVVKRFSEYASTKWILISPTVDLITLIGIRPKALPSTRFWNEYRYSIELRKYGINTPRILYIDPWSFTMIKEYIEGVPLSEYIVKGEDLEKAVEIFLRSIADIHSKGLCMIDTKPDNFIVSRDGVIYYVDLEQIERCRKPAHMAWDIAVFSYFTSLEAPSRSLEKIPGIFREKIEIYLENLPYDEKVKKSILKGFSDPRFVPIFLLSLSIVNPIKLKTLIDIFKKLSSINGFSETGPG